MQVIRYIRVMAILALMSGVFAVCIPNDGDAGQKKPDLTIAYTGDTVGKIEPCG